MTGIEFVTLGAVVTAFGLGLAAYAMRWQDKNLPPRK